MEQTRFQKLFRVERLEMNASARSKSVRFCFFSIVCSTFDCSVDTTTESDCSGSGALWLGSGMDEVVFADIVAYKIIEHQSEEQVSAADFFNKLKPFRFVALDSEKWVAWFMIEH